MDGDTEPDRGAHPRELFDDNGIADGVDVGPPEVPRDLKAEKAQRPHLPDDLPGKAGVAIEIIDQGRDFGFGELPNGLAHELVFHAGIEIHDIIANKFSMCVNDQNVWYHPASLSVKENGTERAQND